MATIKPIEGRSVHQIQSGQVIVDLCSVVKELVENSLDAGTTSIEVRFKNQGLDLIEVQDNGDGITPENYETVALKHHTSKLSTYSDLTTLHTFGFRGEALSSLCALSHMTIATCTASEAPKGTKLEFETTGKLKSKSVVAAQKGTTVTIENLFKNLPVRRRELERNIKREWNRVVGVLSQYACIQTGIKFSVTHQAAKGKKTTLFSTKGNPTTRENIVNVFGTKTLAALLPFNLNLELEATRGPSQRWSTQEDGGTKYIRIIGHISKPTVGESRQTPDRQMFFVNSRPCGLPQVAKAFNEVYKTHNNSQTPFIFCNIELDTHLYDVNVSPDKRTILLHDQARMLERLKTSLTALFESQDHSMPISQIPAPKQPAYRQLTITRDSLSQGAGPSKTPVEGDEASENADSASDDDSQEVPRRSESTDRSSRIPASSGKGKRDSNTPKPNLLSNWLGQKTEDRATEKAPASKTSRANSTEISKGKARLAEMLSREGRERITSRTSSEARQSDAAENDTVPDDDDDDETPASTRHTYKPPPAVAAFNEQMAQVQLAPHVKRTYDEPGRRDHQEAIPALPSPSKLMQSGPSSTPRSSRPRYSPVGMATITIGDDHTVTSSIGARSSKRPRLESPSIRENGDEEDGSEKSDLPTFGSTLSQRFGGPGLSGQASQTRKPSDSPRPASSFFGAARRMSIDEEYDDEEIAEAGDEGRPLQGGKAVSVSEQIDSENEVEHEQEVPSDIENAEEQQSASKSSAKVPESPKVDTISETRSTTRESPHSHATDDSDGEYYDEKMRGAQEDARRRKSLESAPEISVLPTAINIRRAENALNGSSKRRFQTVQMVSTINTSIDDIAKEAQNLSTCLRLRESLVNKADKEEEDEGVGNEAKDPEERLSLTITKGDFAKMKIIGQFNLGFILALRPGSSSLSNPNPESSNPSQSSRPKPGAGDDELFIIDQHASDEKYNFERLQATTIVQSQTMVRPLPLTLSAMDEETVLAHLDTLSSNGFGVSFDDSGNTPPGRRCSLTSLPLSRETAFTVADLEELISLLSETEANGGHGVNESGTIMVRPSKVRKMFAMRACRSSVMIGKALTQGRMEKIVKSMGKLDKPWNCPHGRPTMRHLMGLGGWDGVVWGEGEGMGGEKGKTDWGKFVRGGVGGEEGDEEGDEEMNGEDGEGDEEADGEDESEAVDGDEDEDDTVIEEED